MKQTLILSHIPPSSDPAWSPLLLPPSLHSLIPSSSLPPSLWCHSSLAPGGEGGRDVGKDGWREGWKAEGGGLPSSVPMFTPSQCRPTSSSALQESVLFMTILINVSTFSFKLTQFVKKKKKKENCNLWHFCFL